MNQELVIKHILQFAGLLILATVFVLFSIFVIIHLFFKGDIVKIHDFHLVKRQLEEGSSYYTLHTRESKWPWSKYRAIGEYYHDISMNYNKFIVYKFNSVEEAEDFYDNL